MKPLPTEVALLQAWAQSREPAHLKWARRAWCVLASGLDSRALASMGLSEDRVLALRDAYAQMGLVGLADAPRAGRPRRHETACAAQPGGGDGACGEGSSAKAHARWRDARRRGQVLARQRGAVALLMTAPWGEAVPFALWMGAGLRMTAWRPRPTQPVVPGLWFHPVPAARAHAGREGAVTMTGGKLLALTAAITAHAQHARAATARGERDKLAFWMGAVAAAAGAPGSGAVRLTVQVDDALGALPVLLSALRRHELWHGPGGRLAGLAWVSRGAWWDALGPLKGPLRSMPGAAGQAAFAWAPPIKAQSVPGRGGLHHGIDGPARHSG